jgi:hypothetical protein
MDYLTKSVEKKNKQTKIEGTTTNQPTNKQTNKQTSSPPKQQHHPQLVLHHQEMHVEGKKKPKVSSPCWAVSKAQQCIAEEKLQKPGTREESSSSCCCNQCLGVKIRVWCSYRTKLPCSQFLQS